MELAALSWNKTNQTFGGAVSHSSGLSLRYSGLYFPIEVIPCEGALTFLTPGFRETVSSPLSSLLSVAGLVTGLVVFSATPAHGWDCGLSDLVIYHPKRTFQNEKGYYE